LVCGVKDLRRGIDTTSRPPSLALRVGADFATYVQAVSRAVRYVTRIVPGFRSGPDLPRVVGLGLTQGLNAVGATSIDSPKIDTWT